eukprot:TRINITY_DN22719_c0_g1_i2.p2 TRINITY_DN22719_c0_g1~~TRINITY_DN22719_c0_g1_i2.p2  ORF type:complete len:147 (-),score=51.74 TRINITY_DN22719_c0_g1_i2:63-503(-)
MSKQLAIGLLLVASLCLVSGDIWLDVYNAQNCAGNRIPSASVITFSDKYCTGNISYWSYQVSCAGASQNGTKGFTATIQRCGDYRPTGDNCYVCNNGMGGATVTSFNQACFTTPEGTSLRIQCSPAVMNVLPYVTFLVAALVALLL